MTARTITARQTLAWLAALLALALLAVPGPASARDGASGADAQRRAGDADPTKVHPDLRAGLESSAADTPIEALVVLRAKPDLSNIVGDRAAVVTALRATARASQRGVAAVIEARGDRVVNPFWIHNMLLVEATAETLVEVAGHPGVARIVPNFTVEVPEPAATGDPGAAIVDDRTYGIDRIRAHEVWSGIGVDGAGVRVATLDTGVDVGHPDLTGKLVTDDAGDPAYPGGWMEFDGSGNPVAGTPHDSATHGTHVAGTIHGGDDSDVAIGVAPGAAMMHGLVIPGGSGTFAQVAGGMQWAIEPFDADGDPAGMPADVVNMSLGGNGFHQEMVAPTRNMRAAGTFPAFAIGNNCGSAGTASPGNVYEAVGVGATDADDDVASFSCGGVVQASQFPSPPDDWPESWVKPNISAPGVDTWSAAPGGGYRYASGTSMATPHVAGTVALMLAASGGLPVDEAFDVLATTSFFDDRHGEDRPNTRFGEGRIDALEAVTQVAYDSGIDGTVTDASSGAPVAGALVRVTDTGATRTTADDGSFGLRLAPGTYTLEVSRFGYDGASASATVVEGEFTTVDVALEALPAGDIAGTATYAPSGDGLPGARVRVLDVPVPFEAETGADGDYTIAGVPEGTYVVEASAHGLPAPPPVEVTVTADATAIADFAFERPDRVAVLGDYGDKLTDELTAAGHDVEPHSWGTLGDPGTYSAIVVNRPGNPGQESFLAFLEATDAAGTGVVFLDTWSTSGNGVWLLHTHLSNPAARGTGFSSSIDELTYEVVAAHPALDGYEPGDVIVHDDAASGSDKDHAWFGGYEGEGRTVLADAARNDQGVVGQGIGVQDRGASRHVLLSMHGASLWAGPDVWTAETRGVFYGALDWVAPDSDEDEARFALWGLDVQPEVVLGGEDVTVTAGVKNVGTAAGDYDATLRVDGETDQTETVTLGAGESTTVEFVTSRDDIGTYTVAVGPLTGQFRVRPPLVAIEASTLDGDPLAGAAVELVGDGVTAVGVTDDHGHLEFEAPEAVTDRTVVVRREATPGHAQAYLLSRPVVIDEDTVLEFAPDETNAVVAELAADAVSASHTTTTYLANEHTAGWGFGHDAGTVVLTPAAYAARHVHTVDGVASQWWLPSAELALAWDEAGAATHAFGGAPAAVLGDVRDQEAPEIAVSWDVVDAHGHSFATVLEGELQPFAGEVARMDAIVDALRAGAAREHDPRLRLTAPGGEVLRSGTVGWEARPFVFSHETAEVLQGWHELGLQVETGAYGDRLAATADLIVPARTLSSATVPAGGMFDVTVVFDAPPTLDGAVTLTESLPDGFAIAAQASTPPVHPRRGFDGSTWTWSHSGGHAYEADGLIEVAYTVQVDADVAAGEYPLDGVAVHEGSGLARGVAGPQSITVD